MIGAKFRNRFTGLTFKLLAVEATRVKLLDIDKGDRIWVSDREFKAAYRQTVSHRRIEWAPPASTSM